MIEKDAFCGWCGTPFGQTASYPRNCGNGDCRRQTWSNPIPVAICLQPVLAKDGRLGLAIAQRAIEPCVGEWALIGGHMENNGENVEQGALREFFEETSVRGGRNPRLKFSEATGHGAVLIIAECDPIDYDDYLAGTPCHENLALDVMFDFRELCFPIHTEASRRWFESNVWNCWQSVTNSATDADRKLEG